MAEIGRPEVPGSNPFKNIAKASTAELEKARAGKNNRKESVGEKLNEVIGYEEKQAFVDRKSHNKMDKDAFLKLLSVQLQHQDPMKPMDQKQFTGDLAQFSQLEQLTSMNEKLGGMGENAPTESKFFGASFLGKRVLTNDASLKYDGRGQSIDVPFYLPENAENVLVRIFDSKNQMIAQVDSESMGRGSQVIKWDGHQMDGTPAVSDNYRIEITAWDKQMNKFKGVTKAEGVVTGVSFENGETVLTVDGTKKVFLRDAVNFSIPGSEKLAPAPAMNQAVDANVAHGQKLPTLKRDVQASYTKNALPLGE